MEAYRRNDLRAPGAYYEDQYRRDRYSDRAFNENYRRDPYADGLPPAQYEREGPSYGQNKDPYYVPRDRNISSMNPGYMEKASSYQKSQL